ncbi:hypothetical protein BBD42_16850 [Paenibacillus sp. BIHB 4019]|uniref:Uncharacterized protein n=1 Tax=Paenibacillus sp. BIHB 4019 TaxID=1870819 RepID=A0A1B2DJT4_9BACL|nr:hypothetical protein [Paenibacillus sp. BIHB 4019]ANY67956.1 hypothetical protein BBD42_16850 [Paenibacillus sp. BIHB 4019]
MTKNNKTKKSSLMVTSSLLVAIMLATAACSSNSNNAPAASSSPVATDEQPATVSPTPEESAAPSPSDGGSVTEPGEASPESSTDTPTANPDLKTGEGVFNGLIDTHSIEVDTPSGTIVLQINDELLDVINSLPEKSKIKYQYVEKDLDGFTQMWAEKIEKQ